jgi:hypothetical protein
MLSSYPITINNEVIPYPDTWEETPKKITNTFQTEAGGVQKIVTRGSRLCVTCSFTVTSRWLKKFMGFRDANSITVSIYDPNTEAMATHTMFIEDESFRYERIKESRYAANTNGLYKLSFDMEAF